MPDDYKNTSAAEESEYAPAPKKGGRVKRHCAKWWWLHLIIFIIVAVVVVVVM